MSHTGADLGSANRTQRADGAEEAARQLELGRARREAKDLPAALHHFEAAIAAAPASVAAKQAAAAVLLDLGRLAEAETNYLAVLEQAPKDFAALMGLGRLARRRADPAIAVGYFERAVASDPQAVPARIVLGETLRELGHLDKAEAVFRAILEQRGDHAEAIAQLGYVERRRGDFPAAVLWFEKALALEPQRPWVRLALGDALANLERFDEAQGAYHQSIAAGAPPAAAWLALGDLGRRRNDLEGALAWFEQAAAAAPADPIPRVRAAQVLQRLGRSVEARNAFEAVLEMTPDDVRVLVACGGLEQDLENPAIALALFERARKLAPNDRTIELARVGALNGLSRFDDAAKALAAIAKAPGERDADLEVREFEHLCLTQRYEEALAYLAMWGDCENVPDGAITLTARLYAETGRWTDVLDFVAKRVACKRWLGNASYLCEPIARAARALRAYRQAIALLACIGEPEQKEAIDAVRERLVEEMKLVDLIELPNAEGGVAADWVGWSQAAPAEHFAAALAQSAAAGSRVRIFFCTDGNYLVGACVSLFSLLHHNAASLRRRQITVFCEDDALDLAVSVLGDIGAAFGAEIDVRPSSTLLADAFELRTRWGHFTFGHKLSRAAYYRIFAARQFAIEGGFDRALYLDADTCVVGPVDELLSLDLAGHPLGARLELAKLLSVQRAAGLLGVSPERYFNSGVLLFDLTHPELPQLLDDTIDISVKRRDQLIFLDQCSLNLAFKDRFEPLPGRFNVYVRPNKDETNPADEHSIVHFLQAPKPWDPMSGSPHRLTWLAEFRAMGRLLGPERLRRLLAPLYPAPEPRSLSSAGSPDVTVAEPARPAPATIDDQDWRTAIRPRLTELAAELATGDATLRDGFAKACEEPLALQPLVRFADVMFRSARRNGAERLYRAIAAALPDSPAGPEGLARLAMADQAWEEALSWLERAIATNAAANPQWLSAARGNALLRLRRWPEALDALTEARRLAPEEPAKWEPAIATALMHLGRPSEALAALDASGLRDSANQQVLWCRLSALVAEGRAQDARSALEVALAESEDAEALTWAFEDAARLFDGWPRTRLYLALQDKVERLAAGGDPRLAELRLRIHFALGDRERFLRDVDLLPPRPGRVRQAIHSVAERLRDPTFPDHQRPKVFGIGLSRTGTTSLTKALEILGLSAVHWSNPITGAVLSDQDAHLFDALGDTPVCLNFERDYHRFPNSKFIYTVRPLAAWEASLTELLRIWWGAEGFAAAARREPERMPFGKLSQEIHQSLYFNYANFRDAYLAYDRRVRRFFADKPPERFLEINLTAGDGWERICAFLGLPEPATPFPRENAHRGARRAVAAEPSSEPPPAESRDVAVKLACGRALTFKIESAGPEPAGFVLGVMKNGTSLLAALTRHVAQLNSHPFIDLGNAFFHENVREENWAFDPALRDLMRPGAIYGTFRKFPLGLADDPIFLAGRKLMIVRDPRDALVSEYFSTAYSHPIPPPRNGASEVAETLERYRREVLATPIDVRVVRHAWAFLRTYRGFAEVSRQPSTTVVRYEDYIFHKPELIRVIARTFGLSVTDAQIEETVAWADQRPAVEDPTAFVRRVVPGDHREKLQPETIARLNQILAPVMEMFGYAADS